MRSLLDLTLYNTTIPCSTGDEDVSVIRDVFTGPKSLNQLSVKLSAGYIIDVSDVGFGLVKPCFFELNDPPNLEGRSTSMAIF